MVLHFVGGKTSNELSIIKETKKYIVFRCHENTMKYRYNKETGEVQNGTYHNVIKGMSLDIGGSKMNNSDYLTETEKSLFGYTEHIPSEYPPYENEEWNEDEITEIETLNDIFNL